MMSDNSDSSGAGPRRKEMSAQSSSSIFSIPPGLKRLFNQFPLQTYPANELPQRAPTSRDQHSLYIFASQEDASLGEPSYNPSCLRWQAYLKFCGIDFRTIASNNHASPSGALPFLIPSSTDSQQPDPVASAKLQKWVITTSKSTVEEPSDLRYEAYLSLLDHRIRRAWLYTLYLTQNFTSIIIPLYIQQTSSSPPVRFSIAYELRSASQAELLKHAPVIDPEIIYSEAEEALQALDTLLGEDEWFFGADVPGLFDASVFAYTYLLLKPLGKGWKHNRLCQAVFKSNNLAHHQNRIAKRYFPAPSNS